ncbi:GNAT family N-acetyltransferase [Ideonella sp.]|uniref:GNAT family N-acetyltransferase n=1 Tax=Ideonella sp. TaxID=1929293 RepID=UPI0035B33BBA
MTPVDPVPRVCQVSTLARISDLHSETLRGRAERAHCGWSIEFLASVQGEEAGLLSYEDRSDHESAFIYEIFVLPSLRGQGIGGALLSHAERHAVQLGYQVVRLKPYALDQETDQCRLIAWYTKLGYRQTASDPEHMEKRLLLRGTS